MKLKVWIDSEEQEYEVTYSIYSGSGTYDGLFSAISEIQFAPSYSVVINEFFFRANEDVPDYVELFNYGSENIDYITDKVIKKIINSDVKNSIPKLVEYIHFNKKRF